MKFIPVKGTRDFYPEAMRMRNWIADAWRSASLRNGFEEYDSPIFEYLDLFTAKSGDEIASQLFNLTDRGGRNLAIRPEITPSLARMVNAKINALPRPIKWFSIPRLCRAERPQKGRLREFFQWNVDIIGPQDELADAECVLTAVDAMRELGLTSNDVQVCYSSRELLSEVLESLGVKGQSSADVMAVLDKRNKLPAEKFEAMLSDAVGDKTAMAGILKFLDTGAIDPDASPAEIAASAGIAPSENATAAIAKLQAFGGYLKAFGIADWCRYDTGIVRGLAYYTGIVYEVMDVGETLRAIAGGGRYDNLLEVLGGPAVAASGFGMGDVVLGILLEEKQLIGDLAQGVELFVIDGSADMFSDVINVVGRLRSVGAAAEFSYKRQNIGKQLKQADRRGACKAVILEPDGVVMIKDLASGEQTACKLAEILSDPTTIL
ncbi:MAG: histidine--tRNA ligase [Phycisphaerales bacterium]|jgi:histidyl-tRNA synthetase|nr:histidine--tRNA ligase [Phycisphaerales bacterium]